MCFFHIGIDKFSMPCLRCLPFAKNRTTPWGFCYWFDQQTRAGTKRNPITRCTATKSFDKLVHELPKDLVKFYPAFYDSWPKWIKTLPSAHCCWSDIEQTYELKTNELSWCEAITTWRTLAHIVVLPDNFLSTSKPLTWAADHLHYYTDRMWKFNSPSFILLPNEARRP